MNKTGKSWYIGIYSIKKSLSYGENSNLHNASQLCLVSWLALTQLNYIGKLHRSTGKLSLKVGASLYAPIERKLMQ